MRDRVRSLWRRVTRLLFLWVTMFRYRSQRVNRMVQDSAGSEVCLVLGKKLLPVLDGLHVRK